MLKEHVVHGPYTILMKMIGIDVPVEAVTEDPRVIDQAAHAAFELARGLDVYPARAYEAVDMMEPPAMTITREHIDSPVAAAAPMIFTSPNMPGVVMQLHDKVGAIVFYGEGDVVDVMPMGGDGEVMRGEYLYGIAEIAMRAQGRELYRVNNLARRGAAC